MGNLRIAVIFTVLLFSILPTSFAETPTIVWEKDITRLSMFSISPNGEHIAIASTIELNGNEDKLAFYEKTGELLWEYEAPGLILDMDVSNNGNIIIGTKFTVYNYEPNLTVFDKDGKIVWTRRTFSINKVGISHDGLASTAYGRIGKHYEETQDDIYWFNSLGNIRSFSYRHGDVTEPLDMAISSESGLLAFSFKPINGTKYPTSLYIFDEGGNPFEESVYTGSSESWVTEVSISNDGKYVVAIEFTTEYMNKLILIDTGARWIDFKEIVRDGIFDVLLSSDAGKIILGGRDNVYEYNRAGKVINTFETTKTVDTPSAGSVQISVSEVGTYLVKGKDGKLYFLSGQVDETPAPTTTAPPNTEVPMAVYGVEGEVEAVYGVEGEVETTTPPPTTSVPLTTTPTPTTTVAPTTPPTTESPTTNGACGPTLITALAVIPLLAIKRRMRS